MIERKTLFSCSYRGSAFKHIHNTTPTSLQCYRIFLSSFFFTFCLPTFSFPSPYFLQENYNTLLIKYAEAENTIDRMRLEAKVVHKEVGP